ncbi:hypothetical protein X798_07260, partial [Onchocerca flexuosa]
MLLPLMKLLDWCRKSAEKRNFTPSNTDKHFVLLLNQICTKLAEDATLLHFFFDFDCDGDERFLVFNLLIPYLYDSGEVGQLARDALLLILSVSRRLKHIAAFIAIKSNFCPVVATGLSGCFSQLSRSVGSMLYVSDDWHKINADNIDSHSSLLDFQSSLIFCNAVIQVAHSYVVSQIITYVYHGFLLPVVLPSLLQGGQDELISSTVYYHLCLDSVTEPALIQAIIKLLLIESCEDNKKVLDVIVERISAGNRAFARHSSIRSSVASVRNDLNRYFMNRKAHATAESLRQHTPLPELGKQESSSRSSFPYDIADSSPVPDDEELIIPPLTSKSLMMMTSSTDYFQFAYGELSETDTEAINPNIIGINEASSQAVSDKGSFASTNATCDTDIEIARSFVLRGWGQVEDTDTFMALLDRVPATKVKHSLEENLALIDSRIQYLEELKAETIPPESENDNFKGDTKNNDDDEYLAPLGQPIECFENRGMIDFYEGVGPFLESILRSLENMLDNSLYVTLQTTSILAALASYPQPLIAHYLFDQCMHLQPNVKSLFKV